VQEKSACECLFQRRVFVRVRLWKRYLSILFATPVNPWGATNIFTRAFGRAFFIGTPCMNDSLGV
jgi:hypothetical protein